MMTAQTLDFGPLEWGPLRHCQCWHSDVCEAGPVRNLINMNIKHHGDVVDLSLDNLETIHAWLQSVLEQTELAILLVFSSFSSDPSSCDYFDHCIPNSLRCICNQALADSIWFYMLLHHK